MLRVFNSKNEFLPFRFLNHFSMSYKTEHRTKKTETMLKRKNGSNTEREKCLKPATARTVWELTQWNIPDPRPLRTPKETLGLEYSTV